MQYVMLVRLGLVVWLAFSHSDSFGLHCSTAMFRARNPVSMGVYRRHEALQYRGILDLEGQEYFLFESESGLKPLETSRFAIQEYSGTRLEGIHPIAGVSLFVADPNMKRVYVLIPTLDQYNRWGEWLKTYFRLKRYPMKTIDEAFYADDFPHRNVPVSLRYLEHDFGDHLIGYLFFPEIIAEKWNLRTERLAAAASRARKNTRRKRELEEERDAYLELYDRLSSDLTAALGATHSRKKMIEDVFSVFQEYVEGDPQTLRSIDSATLLRVATQTVDRFRRLAKIAFPENIGFYEISAAIREGQLIGARTDR